MPQSEALESAQQVLLRLRIEKEGEARGASLRLALRRQASGFELRASDPLGRALWTLRVLPTGAWWMDPRSRRACALSVERGARALGWPDLPWQVLAAVLLGEPPVEHDGVDAAGRWWETERSESNQQLAWSVREGAGGAFMARYRREGDTHFLSSASPQVEVRWNEVAREAVARAARLSEQMPQGFAVGGCDELELP